MVQVLKKIGKGYKYNVEYMDDIVIVYKYNSNELINVHPIEDFEKIKPYIKHEIGMEIDNRTETYLSKSELVMLSDIRTALDSYTESKESLYI